MARPYARNAIWENTPRVDRLSNFVPGDAATHFQNAKEIEPTKNTTIKGQRAFTPLPRSE